VQGKKRVRAKGFYSRRSSSKGKKKEKKLGEKFRGQNGKERANDPVTAREKT